MCIRDSSDVVLSDNLRVATQAVLLAAYFYLPFDRIPSLRRYHHDELSPDQVAYDEVPKTKSYTLDKYECPALGRWRTALDLQKAHQKASLGLELAPTSSRSSRDAPVSAEPSEMDHERSEVMEGIAEGEAGVNTHV